MRGFLTRLYALSVLDEAMLIYPFYAVMFVDYGLTAMQISILFAVWSGTVILLEVPSGALADRFSRKRVLFVGQLIRIAGYGCWAVVPGFWGFLLGFVLWGIEGSLSSGTFEALVYDELKRLGREADYAKVIGRTRAAALVGITVSAAVASLVVAYGYAALLLASICATLGTALLVLSLPSAPAVESTGERQYLAILRQGVGYAVRAPSVLRVIVFSALVITLAGTMDEYWTIFADEAGLPRAALGVFVAVGYIVQAIGGVVAYRFEGLTERWFYASVALSGSLLIVAAWSMHPLSLVLIIVFGLIHKVVEVVFEARLQRLIPSDTRATVASVRGFASEVVGLPMFLAMGIIVGDGPYQPGFFVFGALTAVVGVGYGLTSMKPSRMPPDGARLPGSGGCG